MTDIRHLINLIENIEASQPEDEIVTEKGLFSFLFPKDQGPSPERIRQATTPRADIENAKEWGGEDFFKHRAEPGAKKRPMTRKPKDIVRQDPQ